ncbi:hypothetical protein OKW35_004712 [Paraburkholderia sp. MM5477-R1]
MTHPGQQPAGCSVSSDGVHAGRARPVARSRPRASWVTFSAMGDQLPRWPVRGDNAGYRGQPATLAGPAAVEAPGPRFRCAAPQGPNRPRRRRPGAWRGRGAPGVHRIESGFILKPSPPCLHMDSGPPRAGLFVCRASERGGDAGIGVISGLIRRAPDPLPPLATREVRRRASESGSHPVLPVNDKNSAKADDRQWDGVRLLPVALLTLAKGCRRMSAPATNE